MWQALLVAAVLLLQPQDPKQPPLDTAKIEQLTGLKGSMNAQEGVFKVSAPRTDVPVKVEGRTLEPFMGLTSWAAFKPGEKAGTMVMGDLVLFQDEVSPVMSAALDAGLSVTALHNHFFFDEPHVFFMHISGEGKLEDLASAVRKSLDAAAKIRAARPQPAASFDDRQVSMKNAVSVKPVEEALGLKCMASNGMVKAVIGRTTTMACGCEAGKDMGVNTWAAFAGTDELAMVDGDFVCAEGELQTVLKALRSHAINVVAIHNHMSGETPRMVFLHYMAKGPAKELAQAVKAALDAQAKVASKSP